MNFPRAAAALTRITDMGFFIRADAARMYFRLPLPPLDRSSYEAILITSQMYVRFSDRESSHPGEKLILIVKGKFPENRWQGKIKSADIPLYNIMADAERGRVHSPRSDRKLWPDYDLTNDEMCTFVRAILSLPMANPWETVTQNSLRKSFDATVARYAKFGPVTPSESPSSPSALLEANGP